MSRYTNAADILPTHLLNALQRFAAGKQLYVPRPEERLGWGELNGTRQALAARNESIRRRRREGATIEALMEEFHLGFESIRKILRAVPARERTG